MTLAFDEMKALDGSIRPAYAQLNAWLGSISPDVLDHRRREAELLFRRIGITFAVYGDADATERLEMTLATMGQLEVQIAMAKVLLEEGKDE